MDLMNSLFSPIVAIFCGSLRSPYLFANEGVLLACSQLASVAGRFFLASAARLYRPLIAFLSESYQCDSS